MRSIYALLLCLASGFIFYQCESIDGINDNTAAIRDIPESSLKLGQEVAKNINNTIRSFYRSGIDYSNVCERNFRNQFYADYARIYPQIQNQSTYNELSDIRFTPEEFAKGVKDLTETQILFINRIIDECAQSNSYNELYQTIKNINNDIKLCVPEIQQERLFNVTSVLYFAFHEIQELEANGFIIQTPTRKISNSLIKSRSEGNDTSFSSSCRKILATVWTIAIGEPTPAGEIVASIATIIYSGVLLYEVWLCAQDDNSESNYNIEKYCQERYSNCTSPIYDGCGMCLRFCLVQGYWPPYDTHKCS